MNIENVEDERPVREIHFEAYVLVGGPFFSTKGCGYCFIMASKTNVKSIVG